MTGSTGGTRWAGAWRRTLLETGDGARDETTDVTWVQGPEIFVDLRVGADAVEGFAGTFETAGDRATWHREIDLGPTPKHPDTGDLRLDGEVLVETGVHASYVEHWRACGPVGPVGSLRTRLVGGGELLGARAGGRVGLAWSDPSSGPVIAILRPAGASLRVRTASRPALVDRSVDLRPEGIPALGLTFAHPITTEGEWV